MKRINQLQVILELHPEYKTRDFVIKSQFVYHGIIEGLEPTNKHGMHSYNRLYLKSNACTLPMIKKHFNMFCTNDIPLNPYVTFGYLYRRRWIKDSYIDVDMMRNISMNKNITISQVIEHPEINWDYSWFLAREDLILKDLISLPTQNLLKHVNFKSRFWQELLSIEGNEMSPSNFAVNSCVTWEMINDGKFFDQTNCLRFKYFAKNKNLTRRIFEANRDKPWGDGIYSQKWMTWELFVELDKHDVRLYRKFGKHRILDEKSINDLRIISRLGIFQFYSYERGLLKNKTLTWFYFSKYMTPLNDRYLTGRLGGKTFSCPPTWHYGKNWWFVPAKHKHEVIYLYAICKKHYIPNEIFHPIVEYLFR